VINCQPITAKVPKDRQAEKKKKLRVQLFGGPEPHTLPKADASKPISPKPRKDADEDQREGAPAGVRLIAWHDIARLKRFEEIVAETAVHRLVCLTMAATGRPVGAVAARSRCPGRRWLPRTAAFGGRRRGRGGHLSARARRRAKSMCVSAGLGPIAIDERQIAVAGR